MTDSRDKRKVNKSISRSELPGLEGHMLGTSDWMLLDQARINAFAEVTGDHQFIHVDPERAKATPLGGTIAHGFLTLSLTAGAAEQILPEIKGMAMAFNYGLDKLRFLAPVHAGSRVRARLTLRTVEDEGGNSIKLRSEIIMEIEGQDKPALIAETIAMFVFA